MDQSLALLSAQVQFLDTKLSLIHIPLPLYSNFIAPLLQLLAPANAGDSLAREEADENDDHTRSRRPWAYQHPFVNVSVTSVECSVVCSTALLEQLFVPIRDGLEPHQREQVVISAEEFICIQVDGESMDASQRVLELSSPLAMNGISIFFITTYFSDYILVPLRSKASVMSALEARGFAFHADAEAFVNIASPLMQPHRTPSQGSATINSPSSYFPTPGSPSTTTSQTFKLGSEAYTSISPHKPPTPPPSTVVELQSRTFNLLAKRGIEPFVDPTIQLVQCAGRKDTLRAGTGTHASAELSQLKLQMGLMKCLYTVPRPRFFSVTLTDTEPASILLERRLLGNFACPTTGASWEASVQAVLIGNTEDTLVPVSLDLRGLGMQSTTGIVCGVAGAVVGAATNPHSHSHPGTQSDASTTATAGIVGDNSYDEGERVTIEMMYLSTAMAGNVMVADFQLDSAVRALREAGKQGRERVDSGHGAGHAQGQAQGQAQAQGAGDLHKKVEAMEIRGGFAAARDW